MTRMLRTFGWRARVYRHRHACRPGPHPDRRVINEAERIILRARLGIQS